MQQDGKLGLDLVWAAPAGAVDAQEVRIALADLDPVGVIQPAMVEPAALDWTEPIERQDLLAERADAKNGIDSGEHGGRRAPEAFPILSSRYGDGAQLPSARRRGQTLFLQRWAL
jgi:hypothetical protein